MGHGSDRPCSPMIHFVSTHVQVERPRASIQNLHRMGCAIGYIQKFQDLHFQKPDMENAKAFSHFVVGFNPKFKPRVTTTLVGMTVMQQSLWEKESIVIKGRNLVNQRRIEVSRETKIRKRVRKEMVMYNSIWSNGELHRRKE